MKNFKAYFKRDASHASRASYTSHLASLPITLTLTLAFAFHAFAGVGVTKKQLDRTVSEINSNMSQMVSAEISRNLDGYVDEIAERSVAAATNLLPSFIEGLGQFAEASRFSLLEFDENSLVFDDSYMSNGVFVSRSHKAYFKASWVCPTNKGFTVASSSYPGIPAGTMFAVDEIPVAHTNHPMLVVNASGTPNGGQLVWSRHLIHNADMFSKPLELLWCECRYEIGSVDTNRIISESGLYRVEVLEDVQSSTPAMTAFRMDVVRSDEDTSPGWRVRQPEDAHVVMLTDVGGVFRMAVVNDLGEGGRILGTFTLVPTCLNDAEAHIARNGTPKVSALSRLWRSVKALFVPEAVAGRSCQVFGTDQGVPSFCITWTDENGEELGVTSLSVSRTPPKKRVNDRGEEHDTDEMYVPSPWYTLADWCKVENWVLFPTSYSIYYADALGKYETEKGVRYSVSDRQMNLSTFKALFLDHAGSLKLLYVYPRKVEKRDPCKEGRHSYVHCVCSVCGDVREHHYERSGDCFRCTYEESVFRVDENNEIVEDPGSRSACGHVPDGVRYHGGWHGVGEPVDENGNLRYCGCACGHYGDKNERYWPTGYHGSRAGKGLLRLVLDHDFPTDAFGAEWLPGDENSNEQETWHHAELHCSRKGCGTTRQIVEAHQFYEDDESLHDCSVFGIGDENYHGVKGYCMKCAVETETVDLHRRLMPDEGSGGEPCACVGGVRFDTEGCGEVHHHYVVTACGEVRCLYCLGYHDASPRLSDLEHTGVQPVCSSGDTIILANATYPWTDAEPDRGVVLRARKANAQGHWCGCGLVQLEHNWVRDPDTGEVSCPDKRPPGFDEYWWASFGCGYVRDDPDGGNADYDVKVSVEDVRGGSGSNRGRTYRIGSFSWNPKKGEQPPSPPDLWPDDPNAPTSLPPLNGGSDEMDSLALTVVDFTYLTEFSSRYDTVWTWKDGGWERVGISVWDAVKDLFDLKSIPMFTIHGYGM